MDQTSEGGRIAVRPDQLRVVATGSAPELAGRLGEALGAPVQRLRTERFANENLLCSAEGLEVEGRDVLLVATSRSPVSDHLLELVFGLAALRAEAPRRLVAVLPYFPYARSDRPESPGAPVPARQVAEWIEHAGAERVVTFDLHSSPIAGFFRVPVVELRARDALVPAVRRLGLEAPVVASPDLGGAKRAARFADALDAPLAVVRKRRAGARTTALELVGEVRDRALVLVDDEIATGGTLLHAASLARDRGARRIVAVATHAVFSGDALEQIGRSPLERVIVTDTLPLREGTQPPPALEVVSIVPLLAAAFAKSASA